MTRLPRVFTIPTGVPFLPTLARALLKGELIAGFPGAGGPLALSEATVYVPTQRAAAGLAEALLEASGGESVLLPRIAPLGAFEPDEATAFGALGDDGPTPPAPAAVGALARRHTLAILVRKWGEALKGAIRRADANGLEFDPHEPALVASTPAQAYALAADLAALIDDLIIESVDPGALERLAPAAYDEYWRITLDFLKIAVAHWPQWLAEQGLVDRAAQVAARVEAEVGRLAAGVGRSSGPTVIAGSTGANRATARLIAAIARADRGAVVLPGLDLDLDAPSWEMIGAAEGDETLAGHPQALLNRLTGLIGVRRDEVRILGAPAKPLAARAALVSEALRPADSTAAWRLREAALASAAVADALADVAVIVADHETEEALALAVVLREALNTPRRTAALVTPDPAIARRVAAELCRWGVEVEDSAGRSLGETEAGALARLILAAAADFRPLPVQALLAHPSALFGRAPEARDRAVRALELGVLRAGPIPALDDLDAVFARAAEASADAHAHPAVRALGPAERAEGERIARDCAAALAPLRAPQTSTPLGAWLDAHRAALDAALATEAGERAAPHGLAAIDGLLAEWREAAGEGFPCTLKEYARLMDDALAGVRAPPAPGGHPRLAILGLLEARLLSFDRVLIAGLDEKVWPPAAETDAFLNRPMRARLGLSPPERRIGQPAHDFAAALGAREVVMSRAKKRGGEPTVASRFLLRLGAAAGAGAIAAAEQRGARYLAFARALDKPADVRPIARPTPKPPVGKRPRSLSVTRIETLRRDPYAIYAERILRIQPLGPVEQALGPREAGEAWHGALEDFARAYPAGPLPPGARGILREMARARFATLLGDPGFAGLNWPNVEKALDFFIRFDGDARDAIERIFVESRGELVFPLGDGKPFKLTARADRIDRLRDGGATLIDYKSGTPPGKKEVTIGLAPQLTLEAAILMQGGFPDIGALPPREALYLKLGGANGGEARAAAEKNAGIAELAARHFADLKALLDQFTSPETPYLSRPMPKFASRFSDYDHLARVKEWSAAGGGADASEGEP